MILNEMQTGFFQTFPINFECRQTRFEQAE
jgi:hypothetical protein